MTHVTPRRPSRDTGNGHSHRDKKLLPSLADRFSARRGTYRIIYRIDDDTHTVAVVDIDHRRDAYRS